LAKDKWSNPIALTCTQCVNYIENIVGNVRHVISGIGFVTESVSAKVNSAYCVTEFSKASRWPVPQAGIRGEAVNKKDWNARGLVNR
jgi:hypothetical protein